MAQVCAHPPAVYFEWFGHGQSYHGRQDGGAEQEYLLSKTKVKRD